MIIAKFLLFNALVGISPRKLKNIFHISRHLNNFEDGPSVFQVTEPFDHSEGPSWDGRKNILYFVDIHSGRLLSYDYYSDKVNAITLNGDVTPAVQAKQKDLIYVGVNRSVVAVRWDGKSNKLTSQKILTTVSQQFPTSRFNDGKADSKGRLWWGTMGSEDSAGNLTPNNGVFYKITSKNIASPDVMVAPVNISNGLAWNRADNKFFYIDTPTRKIVSYDFNASKGTISNRKVVFDLSEHEELAGNPDGMTIDENDNLWIALYGGGCVIHVETRTGKLLARIAIPALNVTSVMFGGPNLDILFVTSSRYTLSAQERKQQPAAGAVFAIKNLKVKGLPVYLADLTNIKMKGIKFTIFRHNFDGPAIFQIGEPLEHGECPHWDEIKQLLYYVDIHQGKIYSYDYNSKEIHSIQLNGQVAPVTPTKNNGDMLIVGLNKSIISIEWDGKNDLKNQKLLVNLQNESEVRLNEGKADKEGRIWYGTIGQNSDKLFVSNEGALHKITKDNLNSPETVISPVNISNGLAWNKKNDKFYYIDSETYKIVEYDYNNEKGKISNPRWIIDVKEHGLNFHPDGMTIDTDDNLWVALYGGGSVLKVNSTSGEILERIAIPAECITSVAWGGPNLDVLFVTTSKFSLTDEEKSKQPAAGSLFAVTNLGAKGYPMYRADITE
ncbi:unnamed protein product [Brassicogethes aeneus]|uniref:Regucalcin n=1 Tax=Brassicogethes aeneus TaxID=1431903 RepID=A0A9P0FH80_BRAAE|nr:unnamed protein product [Brassicogethes aeneus]